jgi:hypothetical protein
MSMRWEKTRCLLQVRNATMAAVLEAAAAAVL